MLQSAKYIRKDVIFIGIAIISLVMHFNHFPKEIMSFHSWRQTQTQSTINNFYEEDMNIFNPRKNERGNEDGIFRMEFPLMQWLVAVLYKIFGQHLIITRIFMFVIGLISVLGIYALLYALFNIEHLALIGAWAFNFSPAFYYYTINPLPDNLALCLSIWGIALFFVWYNTGRGYMLVISGLLLALGALCKLPFILYYLVPLFFFSKKFLSERSIKKLLVPFTLTITFILLPLAWYVRVVPHWEGNGIVEGMLENKFSVAILLDYLQHNLVSTLPELLLNYGSLVFFISGFYFLYQRRAFRDSRFLLIIVWSIAVLAYFLFELNMIAKVHDYYLFPFYPLLFILVAYGAYYLLNSKQSFFRYLTLVLLAVLPLTAYLRMKDRWDPEKPGFNKDLLVYKNELRNLVSKNALCVVGNDESHFIFLYYVDKKGWVFDHNNITSNTIQEMISKGAEYLYSDTREVDSRPEIKVHLEKKVFEKGTIKVFKLKTNK